MSTPASTEYDAMPRLSWQLALARAIAALALLAIAGWLIA
jgi:hypothetical protein